MGGRAYYGKKMETKAWREEVQYLMGRPCRETRGGGWVVGGGKRNVKICIDKSRVLTRDSGGDGGKEWLHGSATETFIHIGSENGKIKKK